MKPRISTLLFSAALSATCLGAAAATLEVPSQYPTITAAIENAQNGDTVRVAPGTYLENLDFLGKSITVTSFFEPGGNWRIVESTLIDGGNPADSSAASTVSFQSGEGRDTVLQGFTITGGRGTRWVDPKYPSYTWRGGGGVFCFQSSPTIRCNLIFGNEAQNYSDVDGAQGGGVLAFGGDPLVANTIVTGNSAEYGGGVVVDYSGATIRNTIISHNSSGSSYGGAGIWTIGHGDEPILIENSAIVHNSSPRFAGALYVWTSAVEIRSSIIWGNEQVIGDPIWRTNGGSVRLTYSDVEGGFEGEGNIDVEPRFIGPWHCVIDSASACVDSGDPDPAAADPEDPARPGRAVWPARGGLRNDIGPYGGPGGLAMGPRLATFHDSEASPSPAEIE